MKYSEFNSIIQLTEKSYLLYNAFSDQFIVFDSALKTTIENRSFDMLPHFLDMLKTGGFCIDKKVDEWERLREIQQTVDYTEESYLLTVNPTLDCNFRCWYCYEKHLKNSKMNPEVIQSLRQLIANIITTQPRLKYISLSFFGGEPLLYFKQVADPIISFFTSVCKENNIEYSIGFTSNGYLITPNLIDIFKTYRVNFFQITLDGCREAHNKVRYDARGKGSYDVILNNVMCLIEAQIRVCLRINYTAENLPGLQEILNDLSDVTPEMKQYLNVDFQRVWQDKNNLENIEGEQNNTIGLFKENGFRTSYKNIDYIRSSCYADKRYQALINYNGDVFKCTARDFTSARRDGYLNEQGEIMWENDALNRRMNAKLKNETCLSCRIAPLCSGGCSQNAIENSSRPYCLMGFDDKKKDQVILNRFMNRFVEQ